jgi:hypothetical protein
MYRKQKGSADIPGQEEVPQVERYPGSDVMGMEYTTARPMGFETGADPDVYLPGRPWKQWNDNKSMRFAATVKGKLVANKGKGE